MRTRTDATDPPTKPATGNGDAGVDAAMRGTPLRRSGRSCARLLYPVALGLAMIMTSPFILATSQSRASADDATPFQALGSLPFGAEFSPTDVGTPADEYWNP